MNNDYCYQTTDLYLCIFLSLKGFKYNIEKNKKGICTFKFVLSNSDEIDKLKEEKNNYYANAEVKILDFKNKLRDTKSSIINLNPEE
jgi:hypothetical protein